MKMKSLPFKGKMRGGNTTGVAAAASNAAKGPITEWTQQSVVIVLILAALFTIVLVVIYIVSMVKKNKLQNVVLHDKIITLDNRDAVPYTVEANTMSLVTQGQEFSYSMWIYLGEHYEPTTDHKLIFQRGNSSIPTTSTTPTQAQPAGAAAPAAPVGLYTQYNTNANPIIFLDKNTNKMYFAISTTAVQTSKTLDEIIAKHPTTNRYVSGYLITQIDYVPLQRWVNITLAVKDNTAYVFMDGDMYSAVSVSDVIPPNSTQRPVLRGTNGQATIGDKRYSTKGFVSLTRYFNYSLTQSEVKDLYNSGPMKKSVLAFIGLDNYGLRAPIYNISDDAKSR